MMNRKGLFSTLLTSAALSFSATSFSNGVSTSPSSQDDGSGLLIGVQAGYADTHWDNIHHNAFTNFALNVDEDAGVGARVYIGYAINRYFASELGGTYLGNAEIFRHTLADPQHRKMTTIKNYAYDFTTRFNAPINDTLGIFGRVGIGYLISSHSLNWRTIPFIPISNDPARRHTTNLNVTFGAGAYFNVTPCTRVELAWTRFEGNSNLEDSYQPNPDFISVGISYRWHLGSA